MGRLTVHGALFVAILMWGLVFVGNFELIQEIDSLQLVTVRFALVSVSFLVVFALVPETRPRLDLNQLGLMVLAGVLAVPLTQLSLVEAQHYLSPPLVSALIATSPAMAAGFAGLFLSERVSRRQVVGFGFAMAGAVVVIVLGSADETLTVSNPWGAALALLSAAGWALYTVLSKPMSARYPPITSVGVAMIAGTVVMAPLYPHAIGSLGDIGAANWGWMAYLVLGGTTIPYVIWYWALQSLSASRTAAYLFGIPFAALLWSWLLLDVVPAAAGLAGGAVIIVGVALTQLPQRALNRVAD